MNKLIFSYSIFEFCLFIYQVLPVINEIKLNRMNRFQVNRENYDRVFEKLNCDTPFPQTRKDEPGQEPLLLRLKGHPNIENKPKSYLTLR